jgi:hypothetical protein
MDQAKAKSSPGGREVAKARPGKAVRAGDRKQPQVVSAFGDKKSARQAKRDSDRGLKSRSRTKTEVKPNRDRSGGKAFAQSGGGGKARGADRGKKKSRGGRR